MTSFSQGILYTRDVCLKLKEAAQTPEMRTVIRYVMKMSAQNR